MYRKKDLGPYDAGKEGMGPV